MAKQYDFTKLYFICVNGDKVHPNEVVSQGFSTYELARKALQNDNSKMIYDEQGNEAIKKSIHGFYLVPEALIDNRKEK